LVRNLRTGDPKNSLFGMMNYTKTAGGSRLLRSTILQPLCDLATIETRLSCVDELLANEKLFFEMGGLLSDFLDLDHLAALQFVQAPPSAGLYGCEQAISNIIFLKQSMDVAIALGKALAASNSGAGPRNVLLRTMMTNLRRPELQVVRENIGAYIEPDAHKRAGAVAMRTERYFAVKAGLNGLLDVARKTYVEVLDDVQDLLGQYVKEYLMDSLSLKNNARRGYFFSLSSKSKCLPTDFDVFLHVAKTANGGWSFTSEELESFNERLRESGAEISLLTAKVKGEKEVDVDFLKKS
jgi:DNA mismatch repair protein MSH4